MTDASKGRRAKALLALVSAVIALLLAEGAIRIIKRGVPFQPDPDLIRSLRPNVHAPVWTWDVPGNLEGNPAPVPAQPFLAGYNPTNNIGFRMADDVGPKAPDERRVLLLGDSFTEGDQVPGERRFSYLVDQKLKAATKDGPEHWRLLNGGIQNGSPSQYILQLRRWLDAVKPDVVIVDLAPNDATDDSAFESQYGFTFDAEGRPLALQARTTLAALQGSYLLRYLNVALLRSATASRLFFPPVSPGIPIPETTDMFCRAEPVVRGIFQAKTGKYLKQIKEMVEAKGARFGVFMIQYMWVFADEPFHEAMLPGLREQLDKAGCLASRGLAYNAFVEGYLRDAGMAFADPYDALLRAKAENPKRKLWHYVDYHFSPAGHRVIGEELSAFVDRLRAPR
jgi:hypothetical protein